MAADNDRGIRVFISSTFKDMLAERDVLVSRTFPALRAKLRDRGIELCEIDLRWGITEEQAERGDTLPILFSEIDRCRPFFIGILGNRYGWIPSDDVLTGELMRAYPWLSEVRGRSVTEMEIRHGALLQTNADAMFFERTSDAGIAIHEEAQAQTKLANLKAAVRGSGVAVFDYDAPASLGEAVEKALLALIERRFPPTAPLDRAHRAERLHAAFARERRRLYVGGDQYQHTLRRWLERPGSPLLVTGTSGGGKSALLANFAESCRSANCVVVEHYLGSAPDAGDHVDVLRRVWSAFARALPAIPETPAITANLIARFPEMLAAASAALEPSNQRALIVIDGLDKLTSGTDLNWWPPFLPANVHLLASSLPGFAHDAALARRWATLAVVPLTAPQRREVMQAILHKFGKTISDGLAARVLNHAQSGTPLYLRTVLDELRRFGSHEELDERVSYFLAAPDVVRLFDRVLERLEKDHGCPIVEGAARLIWAARAGLEEAELMAALRLAPLDWSALRNGFGDTLRDQDGRLFFDHDYLRAAVFSRYLDGDERVKETHLRLADHFACQSPSLRRSEELPFQLGKAQAWARLKDVLTDMTEFVRLRMRGDVELLGHWLTLGEAHAQPGPALTAALRDYTGDTPWTADQLALAKDVAEFLRFAGVRGPEIVALARHRVEQARNAGHEADMVSANAALANALFDEREYDDACALQERNAAHASHVHGPRSREALKQRADHARMLRIRALREAALRYRGEFRSSFGLPPDTEFGRTLSAEEEEARAEDILRQQLFLPNFIRLDPSSELLSAADIEAGVLDDVLTAFGENDELALDSAAALAGIQRLAGNINAAKLLQEEVVERRLRLAGANHPDTVKAVESYVEILSALRFLDSARSAQESVLEKRRATLGESHPLTVRSKKLLADILSFVDDDAASLALKREIQTGRRTAVVSPPSPPPPSAQARELWKGALLLGLAILIAWATYNADTLIAEVTRLTEQARSLLNLD